VLVQVLFDNYVLHNARFVYVHNDVGYTHSVWRLVRPRNVPADNDVRLFSVSCLLPCQPHQHQQHISISNCIGQPVSKQITELVYTTKRSENDVKSS